MKDNSIFSIHQALLSLRSRLSSSGVFTYDNIQELECHVKDGYEINREAHADKEAYELSLESLGDTEVLIDQYYQANRKNIYRNYFWMMIMSLFFWICISKIFSWLHTSSIIVLQNSLSEGAAEFFVPGFMFGLCSLYTYLLYWFTNHSPQIYRWLSKQLLHRPLYILFAILIPLLPYAFKISFISFWGVENMGFNPHWSQGVWMLCYYLAPAIILIKELSIYGKKKSQPTTERLNVNLRICSLAGVLLVFVYNISAALLSMGSMILMKSLGLSWPFEVILLISLFLVFPLWLGNIRLAYKYPEKSFAYMKARIQKKHSYRYFFLIYFLAYSIYMGLKISLISFISPQEYGIYSLHETIAIELILTNGLLILAMIWTYKRARRQKMIAMS